MIFDKLENAGCYYGISAGLDRALGFLENEAADMDEAEIHDLGDGITARCFTYQSRAVSEGLIEAHRAYIDVMLLKEGCEDIGYKPVEELENITQQYDEEKDALLAKDEGITLLPFSQGCIAVFFPQDAHMGGISAGEAKTVKRVVIKVPV
jgi:YhcH/YjgK/YiaL family protein